MTITEGLFIAWTLAIVAAAVTLFIYRPAFPLFQLSALCLQHLYNQHRKSQNL